VGRGGRPSTHLFSKNTQDSIINTKKRGENGQILGLTYSFPIGGKTARDEGADVQGVDKRYLSLDVPVTRWGGGISKRSKGGEGSPWGTTNGQECQARPAKKFLSIMTVVGVGP